MQMLIFTVAYRNKFIYKQTCDTILNFFNICISSNSQAKKKSLEDKWHFTLISSCWEEGFEPQHQQQDEPFSDKSPQRHLACMRKKGSPGAGETGQPLAKSKSSAPSSLQNRHAISPTLQKSPTYEVGLIIIILQINFNGEG